MKFFLVSVVSTAVMLMGVSLVYGATGSVFLSQIDCRARRGRRGAAGRGRRRAAHGGRARVQGRRRPVPHVGARHLRRRAGGGGGVPLGGLQGGRLRRADAGADLRARVRRRRLVAGAGRARRADHDRRQRRSRCASSTRSGCWPGRRWRRPATSWCRSAPPRRGDRVLGASMAYLAVYAFVNLAAFSVAALVGSRYPAQRLTDYRGLVRERAGGRLGAGLRAGGAGRAAAGHHRPARQGRGARRGGGPGDLAGGGDGRQRRDRARLLRALARRAVPARRRWSTASRTTYPTGSRPRSG